MTFDWTEGPEPVALQITGACAQHVHAELVGVDGQSVADLTLSRRECVSLANLFVRAIDLIDDTENHERHYIDRGLEQLEQLSG
jgi:hypothetical protein